MSPLSLPRATNPTCSVVVLAWHLEEELLRCLETICGQRDHPECEVIVVLNGATQGVRDLVTFAVEGAVVVDLPTNAGFGHACNAASEVAQGTYLVFLNDDTEVEPDWLARLTQTFSIHKDVGAVASLFLTPEGRVYEAGSRVLANSSTVQLGAGLTVAEAGEQGYLTPRAIDYGSAAGLAVRADVFVSLGGFDPVFRPAYYEDVDLQFRIRERGWQIRFEPTARLVHRAGSSTSRFGLFREWALEKNRALFSHRWRETLATAPATDDPLQLLCTVSTPRPWDEAHTDHGLDKALATLIDLPQTPEYIEWLAACAARWRDERDIALQHASRATENVAQLDVLSARCEKAEQRVAQLEGRLTDLEGRNAWGIIRWRLGVASLRWKRRRMGAH